MTFENIHVYNAEANLLEEKRWDEILNLRTWKIKSPDSVPLVEVPYTYLARPAPSGQMMPDLLSGLQMSMTRGPATPEHNRHGDLYGGHAPQVPVAL